MARPCEPSTKPTTAGCCPSSRRAGASDRRPSAAFIPSRDAKLTRADRGVRGGRSGDGVVVPVGAQPQLPGGVLRDQVAESGGGVGAGPDEPPRPVVELAGG